MADRQQRYPVRVVLPGGQDISAATRAGQTVSDVLGRARDILDPGRIPTLLERAALPYVNDFAGGLFGLEGPLYAASSAPAAAAPVSPRKVTKDTPVAAAAAVVPRRSAGTPLSFNQLRALSQSVPMMGARTPKDQSYAAANDASSALLKAQWDAAAHAEAAGDAGAAAKARQQALDEEFKRRAVLLGARDLLGLSIDGSSKGD